MYLAELDLHGFKSFAQKTSIRFDDGITAIVGPNGCGKSNIVDALRWVLGEQRPSLLRSAAMSNVIFNGTSTRKALGMAEVSVTIHNSKGILPLEYTDVTITRRLFRNGDSEYLLNKTPCRLKDIIELFMDTGMGSNAYSVIELKMVEDILSDKNHDRRRLFEEAAGVTKYKDKRKQTFRKLDETQADMTRIEDILLEVRKNVSSLNRQSNRARQAKELEEELRILDQAVSRVEFTRLQDQLSPLRQRLMDVELEKEQLQRTIEETDQARVLAETNLLEKESRLSQLQASLAEVNAVIQQTNTSIQIASERIESEEKNIKQFEIDVFAGEEEIRNHKMAIKQFEEERDVLLRKREAMDAELQQAQEHYNHLETQVQAAKHALDQANTAYSQANARLTELKTARIRTESRLENGNEEMLRLRQQMDLADQDLDQVTQESKKLDKELKEAKTEHEHSELRYDEAMKRREVLVAESNRLKDVIRTHTGTIQSLEREMELLHNIAQSQEHFPESVQFLLSRKADFSFAAVLTDLLSTHPDLSLALESVLGEACNYIVLGKDQDAEKAISLLKSEKKGRATLISAERIDFDSEVHPDSIAHQVQCDKKWNRLKNLLLGQVVIVEEKQKPPKGTTGVTLQGEVVTREHFIRAGSTNTSTGIRTSLKEKISALEKRIMVAEDANDEEQHALKKIELELEALDLPAMSSAIRQHEQNVRRIESQKSGLTARVQVQGKNHAQMKQRLDTIIAERSTLQNQLEEHQPEAERLQEHITEMYEAVANQRAALETVEQNRNRAQSRYNEVKLAHQDIQNKVDSAVREIERSNEQIEAVKQRVQQRADTAKRAKELIFSYRGQIEEAKTKLELLHRDEQQARNMRDQADEDCMRERGRIKLLDDELRTLRNNREQSLELLHELGLARNQLELDAKHIADQIFENYGLLMDAIEAELPEETTIAQAKTRLIDVRQRLKNIGEVNPLSIEEYEKEVERLNTFETQMADLKEADAQLRQSIKEINDTAQERFLSTFNDIRTNFKTVFSTLFNEDDECDLLLEEDKEDPLESRIEIIAKPRGKRPSAISQLSGGEKTLTAIALLFAIYLVKPSPFCILDEVDAPLDDANIERFARILQRFSADTQFIIITHNKLTMEKARMMYGVTMPETGVSKLVGVRLEEVDSNG